ncbi:uncharacterized protein LOC133288269 isoform X4 [Gastrolobium bilobum]|uniref:uncharacterized protein LOC133288269 isoform X4 n=1 Tax=Gastrolobium bilobum TaxID=150636 RepID=UPI002AAF8922|nr:uncharacterized protein LOC133288269 isoform X4 [Gastrolobium bilobum]
MERTSSCSFAVSRLSISQKVDDDDDAESECVSEAGDIGDRVLHGPRHSERSSENGGVYIHGDHELHQYPAALNYDSYVKSFEPIQTPVSTSGKVLSEDIKQLQELDNKKLLKLLEYVSCLTHLAIFGILGVLTRYLVGKLFGPGVAGVTSDQTILYPDLPSNKVGSFLMGWFGVVFKGDISRVSEHLTIALTTGYLGSLTIFSGWNQKMLELSVDGHWLFSVRGFLIGLLWGVIGALEKDEFKHGGNAAQLWFACTVGPLGVWIRWFLARLNGRGIGAWLFKWLPFGTLIANVSVVRVMTALATRKKSVSFFSILLYKLLMWIRIVLGERFSFQLCC